LMCFFNKDMCVSNTWLLGFSIARHIGHFTEITLQ
jgi:hypothetical protein